MGRLKYSDVGQRKQEAKLKRALFNIDCAEAAGGDERNQDTRMRNYSLSRFINSIGVLPG
jgi:hypothetical protein